MRNGGGSDDSQARCNSADDAVADGFFFGTSVFAVPIFPGERLHADSGGRPWPLVGSRGPSALRVSLAGSAVIVVGEIAVLAVLSVSGRASTKGALLFAVIPITGAALVAVAAALRLRSARPTSHVS